jgi:transcriptional regulator of arginine metabolism
VVTQATISRDIKDLHLFKVAGSEKRYRYTYINGVEGEISPKMKSLFRDCVVSVKSAQNIVVIKTLVGNGANAGTVVDKLNYTEIIGSVAGDDTLLVVCTDTLAAEGVVEKIKDFIR